MNVKIPNWFVRAKRITSKNCLYLYNESLGNKLGTPQHKYISFKQCKKEVKKFNFENSKFYEAARKPTWPPRPDQSYKNEWKGWRDFLGKPEFLSFGDCRKELIKNKIKSQKEYREKRKNNWPPSPEHTYKNKWKGWRHFCGKPEFLSFENCKKELIKNKINNQKEYFQFRKLKNKQSWPSLPSQFFKNKWKGWLDFLGKPKKEPYLTFDMCQKDIIKNKVRSHEHYLEIRKPRWPLCPEYTYRSQWKGWKDFRGRKSISLHELKKEVKISKIKTSREYSKKKKLHWPPRPDYTYKNAWKGWELFLK